MKHFPEILIDCKSDCKSALQGVAIAGVKQVRLVGRGRESSQPASRLKDSSALRQNVLHKFLLTAKYSKRYKNGTRVKHHPRQTSSSDRATWVTGRHPQVSIVRCAVPERIPLPAQL